MRVVIGGDHAGFALKKKVISALERKGIKVIHVGSFTEDAVDFPDIAKSLCEKILTDQADRGIMVCGSGVGAAIACNKIKGIRASVIHDMYTAHQAVEHDNVQVMTIGQDIVGYRLAVDLIEEFLAAHFLQDEEFLRRVEKLDLL